MFHTPYLKGKKLIEAARPEGGFCPFMALLLWLLITQYTSCTVEIIQHALFYSN